MYMYVCVCACVYVHIYKYIYIYVHVHVHIYTHARAHIVTFHTHACIHASPSLAIHARAYMHVIYTCMYVCTSYIHLPPVLPTLHHQNWNPPFRNTQVCLFFPIFLCLPPRLHGFVLGQLSQMVDTHLKWRFEDSEDSD